MNAIIVGFRRQGKSTLAIALAASQHKTILIWDPNDNYRSTAFSQVRPNQNWSGSGETVEQFMERAERSGEIEIARLGPLDQQDIDRHFQDLSDALWEWDDFSLVIDESMLLQNPMRRHPALDRFIRRSTAGMFIVQTCHRMFELNSLSRFLVDELYAFRLELPRERKLITDQFDSELGQVVSELEDREYAKWYRTATGRTYFYRQPDSSIWFVDLRNRNRRSTGGTAGSGHDSTGQKSSQTEPTNQELGAVTGPDEPGDAGIDPDAAAGFIGP